MTKRKVTEESGAQAAAEQAEVQPAERVTARFRLVHLGGQAGDDVRTARLVASAQLDAMVGEINIVLDTPEAIRMFEGGDGVFAVEIKPA